MQRLVITVRPLLGVIFCVSVFSGASPFRLFLSCTSSRRLCEMLVLESVLCSAFGLSAFFLLVRLSASHAKVFPATLLPQLARK